MKKQYFIFMLAAVLTVGCGSGSTAESSQKPTDNKVETTASEESTAEETTLSEQKLAAEAKARKENYIAECQPFQYKEFFRYEEKYKGTKVSLVLEVGQVMDEQFRCYSYSEDSLDIGDEYIILDDRAEKDMRILQDDVITVWGEYVGSMEVTRAINGVSESIPAVRAKYIDLLGENEAVETQVQYSESVNLDSVPEIVSDIFGSGGYYWSWNSDITGYYLIPFISDGTYQIWFTVANDTVWADTAYTVDIDEMEETSSGGVICRGDMYLATRDGDEYNGRVEVTWNSPESVDWCTVKMIDGHQFTETNMVADDYAYYGPTSDSIGGEDYLGSTKADEYYESDGWNAEYIFPYSDIDIIPDEELRAATDEQLAHWQK